MRSLNPIRAISACLAPALAMISFASSVTTAPAAAPEPPRPLMLRLLDCVTYAVFGLLAVLAVAIVASAPVAAQTAGSGGVDLGPLASIAIEYVAPVLGTALTGIAGWALVKFQKVTGLKIEAERRASIEQGIDRAIDSASAKLRDRAKGGIPLGMKSQALASAVRYASEAVPDALRHFNISTTKLEEMVEARLDWELVDENETPSASPMRARPMKRSAG